MFDFIILGQSEIEDHLGEIVDGLAHLPIQKGLDVLGASVLETFAVGGRPEWDDILESSRDGRVADHGTPALWDTGAMADAASATRPGVDGSAYEITPAAGQIGVDALFHGARRHTVGFGIDRIGRHFNEPARPFMILRSEDRVAVVELMDEYIGALLGARK